METFQNHQKITFSTKGGVQKKNKKKVVILLQPPSIYLPTPIGVQKATFLIFFNTHRFVGTQDLFHNPTLYGGLAIMALPYQLWISQIFTFAVTKESHS